MALVSPSSERSRNPKRFLSYRVHRHKAKVIKSRCLSDSDSTLSSRLHGMTLSTIASDADATKRTRNDGDLGRESWEDDLDWSQVPSDPLRRAGILIVVTSPEGKVKLAMCDKENHEVVDEKGGP